ncbi:DUF6049 family protein [Agilicoccus flavus]|uniref:DUF6049 family protein n=1 Tax=Agilicoccus flavus TaxID=2775968 RepID=UPI001CF6EE5C|nr:DUF6049 family protein [Agilicoccus flavus]
MISRGRWAARRGAAAAAVAGLALLPTVPAPDAAAATGPATSGDVVARAPGSPVVAAGGAGGLPSDRASSAPAGAAAAAQTRPDVQVTSVSPAVATPTTPVRVTVEVVNPTTRALTPRRVTVRVGSPGALRSRTQVREFAAGSGRPGDPVAATVPLRGTLAPGSRTPVVVTLPAGLVRTNRAFGVLPVTVEVPGVRAADTMREATFLPYQVRKEYQPLSIAFAVPLTLDPDPQLVVATGDDRTQAWTRAVGPASRLDRLAAATAGLPIAWAVDPSVVGAAEAPADPAAPASAGSEAGGDPTAANPTAAAPTPSTSPSEPAAAPTGAAAQEAAAADEPVSAAQARYAARLRALAGGRDVWALPPGDPDLVALAQSSTGLDILTRWASGSTDLSQTLGLLGVPRIAWPVGGPLDGDDLGPVSRAFGTSGPAAVLSPSSGVDGDPAVTGTATRHTAQGHALLAYDDALSRILARVGGSPSALAAAAGGDDGDGAPTAGEDAQRFLAETVTLLAESPGRRRAALVAGPRDLDPAPGSLPTLLSAVAAAPWLEVRNTAELVTSAREPSSPQVNDLRATVDPLSPGPSPVGTDDLTRIAAAAREITGLAEVLPAPGSRSGATADVLLPDVATLRGLLSSRWRGAGPEFTTAERTVDERLSTLTSGVSVVPSTINFFADRGILQVTVVNDLDVEVHDVHLVVAPQGRPPRLRVTAPTGPLRISPRSRTTVRLRVEAVAAGVVPIATHVETPSGTRLGTDAPVRVRVQPTNGWLMLALGGLVGVVFVAGIYRALRAGSPRVSSEDLKEIDLE